MRKADQISMLEMGCTSVGCFAVGGTSGGAVASDGELSWTIRPRSKLSPEASPAASREGVTRSANLSFEALRVFSSWRNVRSRRARRSASTAYRVWYQVLPASHGHAPYNRRMAPSVRTTKTAAKANASNDTCSPEAAPSGAAQAHLLNHRRVSGWHLWRACNSGKD